MIRAIAFLLGAAIALAAIPTRAAEFLTGEIVVDGRERGYALHAPIASDPAVPMPVVFVLHGGAGRAVSFAGYLNVDQYVNRGRFLAVYPQGFERHWNDGRTDSPHDAHEARVDDIRFLRALVDHLGARFPIDHERIYAAGISNGGMMAYRLACEAADFVAAIAAVAANLPATVVPGCVPSRPVPVLVMNGTADPMMPEMGGDIEVGWRQYGRVLSTDETVAFFARNASCAGLATVEALPDANSGDDSRPIRYRYAPCAAGSEVVLYRIEGGGHTWPGRDRYLPRAIIGAQNEDFDGTGAILEFFGLADMAN